jgi:transposase-like protein
MKKKHYTDDFKQAAVERLNAGESASVIVKDLNIHNSMLHNWRKKFKGVKKKVVRANDVSKDAIIYLQHAIDDMQKELTSGKAKKRKRYHALVELALFTLLGE